MFFFMQIEGQGKFEVHIVDSVNDYVEMVKEIFNFEVLRRLFAERDLKVLIDSMSGGEAL